MTIMIARIPHDSAIRSPASQRGVTIVELMIAMVLGLFLMSSVYFVYSKTKQTYRYQTALAQVQEQGRFAMDVLTQSLRIAGFPGDNVPPGNKIEGTDGASDIVVVRYRNDVDCRDVATGGVAINRFRINAGDLECSGDGVDWDVFVRNVEDMQVLYGEDLDDDGLANRYVTATAGPDWSNVVAARVSLLVRSTDNATAQSEAYRDLLGNTVAALDKRLRKSFVTTISLRN
jgi:type IV pilus assembly protein PilW